jgi:signal transduction histidine kinase
MTKILVIEDDPTLRGEVAEWLTLEGYEVSVAGDGVAGIEFAFRTRPDLIVCDIMMPRLDGYGVLLELRSNLETSNIPFILTTSKVTREDIRKGMVAGADDYVIKPVTRPDLLQAIQTHLEKKATHERNHQREVEQLQTALEHEHKRHLLNAKMVGMYSHDFRNPLTAIMSAISLVRDYADRMDVQRRLTLLNRAEASARQLIQMLDEMLFLAQTDSSSFSLQLEVVYVEQFLEQVVDEFQAIHGETHKLFFESHFADGVMVDPRLLRQIATNLISNAIKYSPQGSEVRVSLDSHDGQYILTVQDRGVGIPDTDQPYLFTAFQRGSNVRDVQGTGLGLVIVKQAVDMLEGSIHFESQVGVGTTITVQIPITAHKE